MPTRIPLYNTPLCSKVLGCALLLAIRWSTRFVGSFKNLWHAYQLWVWCEAAIRQATGLDSRACAVFARLPQQRLQTYGICNVWVIA